MIKIIKLGNAIHENIEYKIPQPTKFDENGNPVEFEEVINPIFPQNEDKLKEAFVNTLNWLTDRYFYGEARKKGDYLNMGEIIYDAQQGDPDAQFLKQLYDAIWQKEEELESEIENMSLEQLLELDLEAWSREAYDQVKAQLEAQTEQN